MYSEQEAPSSLSDEFVQALRLVHSKEADSADALRALLDAAIAQRYGSNKTTMAWMLPPYFYREESERDEQSVEKSIDVTEPLAVKSFTDSGGNNVGARDEVPRISIPDEDQSDGVVCKVCNVAEFGPLILVRCRQCEQLYHPLCHQPPIVDASLTAWRCSECDWELSLDRKLKRSNAFEDSSWIRSDNVKKYSKKRSKKTSTPKISKR